MELAERAATLRAMRAWVHLPQNEAASEAGLAQRTLMEAENGNSCSDKTWLAALALYAKYGLRCTGTDLIVIIADTSPD